MNTQDDLQPGLRQQAVEVLNRLTPSEREALLIKCWMSHDARWFMAVASEFGMEVTNRLNQIAAHELGKAECKRVVRALQLPAVAGADAILLIQEVMIGLLGPNLLDYRVTKVGDSSYQVHVQRCFSYENATRAGVAQYMTCGIFARVTGWFEGLGVPYTIEPQLGACFKAKGEECVYTLSLDPSQPVN
ncbi:MAG: hypothetical protein HY913_02895 [Desulfomonile tiedjei]|nr:hypothetical protein [Desulfomonile tiedjei]